MPKSGCDPHETDPDESRPRWVSWYLIEQHATTVRRPGMVLERCSATPTKLLVWFVSQGRHGSQSAVATPTTTVYSTPRTKRAIFPRHSVRVLAQDALAQLCSPSTNELTCTVPRRPS